MASPIDDIWPDWKAELSLTDEHATHRSLIKLARYANPDMAEAHGLGLGGGALGEAVGDVAGMAWRLAEALDGRQLSWTLDPFTASPESGQLIRTTPELLLQGAGTCLDFAVTLAAMCVRENVPCAIAVAKFDAAPADHAFVVVQAAGLDGSGESDEVTLWDDFARWVEWVTNPESPRTHFIDVTPRWTADGSRIPVRERSDLLLDLLRKSSGTLFVVDVQQALRVAALDPYQLPELRRELGLVGRLPDLPRDWQEFDTHAPVRARLAGADGVLVLHGDRGSGKSTLALERARAADGGRGWFLDASDERTLRTSLAHAEARSMGSRAANPQKEYLETMVSAADRRLRSMNRPWVVVIDNAEGNPTRLNQLIPDPKEGQLVIITTTRDEWGPVVGPERVVEVESLRGEDLGELGTASGLPKDGWLPGLLRIVRQSRLDPGLLTSLDGSPAERVVQAALGIRGQSWSVEPRTRAFAAASFMPAERITVGWLAEAAFAGSLVDARAAVRELVGAGLLEQSRQSFDVRDRDEEPIWMHRLIRDVAHRLLPPDWLDVVWSVIASFAPRSRSTHYTDLELFELADFLEDRVPSGRSPAFAEAAMTVLELLEPRASEGVRRAAQLARAAIRTVEPEAGRRDAQIKALMLVAQARFINQRKDPPPKLEEIEDAIDWCLEAEQLTGLETTEDKLLTGRAAAMRGLLIRKQAGRLRDPEERIALLHEAIEVLTESYESRKHALELEAQARGEEVDDPDQHIDRGWFNLGGANVALAGALRHVDPQQVPGVLRAAMEAYAGSLFLRRRIEHLPPDNTYVAASLWGVALAAYMAALYCPGKLSLEGVMPVDELELLQRDKSRDAMLRTAELAGLGALEMRVVIDGPTGGDTGKMRELLQKILMAWPVREDGASVPARQVLDSLRDFFGDIDVTEDDIVAAVRSVRAESAQPA